MKLENIHKKKNSNIKIKQQSWLTLIRNQNALPISMNDPDLPIGMNDPDLSIPCGGD